MAAPALAARRLVSATEEQTIFVTKAKVATLVRQEKEKVSSVTRCLSLKLPYLASVVTKPYPMGYTVPNFQKFDGWRGSTREHIAHFIDTMRPLSHKTELCL